MLSALPSWRSKINLWLY